MNPLEILGIVFGSLLMIIATIALAIVFTRPNKSDKISKLDIEKQQLTIDTKWHSSGTVPTYVVVEPHVKNKRDEVDLSVGDLITISMTFTDGWLHGVNKTSGLSGLFPLHCIVCLSHNVETQRCGRS